MSISEVKKPVGLICGLLLSVAYCADVLAFTNAYFGEHSSPGTNLTSLQCYGNESQLIDCRHSNTTTCRASRVAGVRCQGKTVAGISAMWCALAIPSETVCTRIVIIFCSECIWLFIFHNFSMHPFVACSMAEIKVWTISSRSIMLWGWHSFGWREGENRRKGRSVQQWGVGDCLWWKGLGL